MEGILDTYFFSWEVLGEDGRFFEIGKIGIEDVLEVIKKVL
jgi:hypothetical protein